MSITLTQQVAAALAAFSSTTRLYELELGDAGSMAGDALLVEAFLSTEALQETGARDVIVLSTSAHLDSARLLGTAATLAISLADGTRTHFRGEVAEAAMLGSDGGFARYRMRLRPWLWRLGQVRNSRVWQDRSVIEIVDEVLGAWLPLARWRWSDDAVAFMRGAVARSYCCQYRETDLDFICRLLADEGLAWRFEEEEDGEGPCAVFFADSSAPRTLPQDATCAQDGVIRFHRVGAVEQQDTVQSLVLARRLHASLTTLLSTDYKSRQAVAASSPSRVRMSGKLPLLESFDAPGQYAYANREQAQRYADLRMEALEARARCWRGRSSVRTLRAGTRIVVTGVPMRQCGEAPSLTVTRVTSVGINNLPPRAEQALAELFGPIPELLEEIGGVSEEMALVIAQAREGGYANCFDAVPAELPWRPALLDDAGRTGAKPTARGAQTAIVIGADGNDRPNGADELYCDRLGRVRIRFHWQDNARASCWVRVAQRAAGGGMGAQFLPRIGQEVLVQFLENDIDRPIIVGALYNGQGEGGVAPTPGGRASGEQAGEVFASANDHVASGQGNLAGGNSPVWHGASNDDAGHRNNAAQWGVRSKEFGGGGYNQLLFDDTDGQGRVQLKSTHAATELNLGHLIHAADNYRGSFRGLGAELRTDACGAVRAGAGLLVTSYKIQHGATAPDSAGELGGALALAKQATQLAATFNTAAQTHQTVGLSSHLGASQAKASFLDDKFAPLEAMFASASGASRKDSFGAADAQLPHFSDPLIVIAAQDGFAANAGQSLQLANGETVTLMSGQDTQCVTGGQMRIHSGQAIGMLGGAVKAGEGGLGLQLITAKDAIDIQAQADELKVQARDEVNVISANAHIDWAAAKRISLSTAGGANITIEGGNITVLCPGKIKVHAGKKSFLPPEKLSYPMPALPRSICVACLKKSLESGPAFTLVE